MISCHEYAVLFVFFPCKKYIMLKLSVRNITNYLSKTWQHATHRVKYTPCPWVVLVDHLYWETGTAIKRYGRLYFFEILFWDSRTRCKVEHKTGGQPTHKVSERRKRRRNYHFYFRLLNGTFLVSRRLQLCAWLKFVKGKSFEACTVDTGQNTLYRLVTCFFCSLE